MLLLQAVAREESVVAYLSSGALGRGSGHGDGGEDRDEDSLELHGCGGEERCLLLGCR